MSSPHFDDPATDDASSAHYGGIDFSKNPQQLPKHTKCGWQTRNLCCAIRRSDAFVSSEDWIFPQRFIMAMLISLLYTIVSFMSTIYWVQSFQSFINIGKNYVTLGEAYLYNITRFVLGDTNVGAYIYNTYLEDNMEKIFEFINNFLDAIKYRFLWTGGVSAGLALLILVLIWVDIIGAYKRNLMAFRLGKMRNRFPAAHFHVGNASRYPGVQAGHCALGYLMVFFALWIALLIFSFRFVRKAIWAFCVDFFFWILGIHLILTVIRVTLINFLVTREFDIKYPRIFALWDFINSLAEVISGLSTTFLRLGVALGGIIMTFPRIHVPLLGWEGLQGFDAGYASFISVVYADHMYNNPVGNVFLYLLLSKRRRKKEETIQQSRFAQSFSRLVSKMSFARRSQKPLLDDNHQKPLLDDKHQASHSTHVYHSTEIDDVLASRKRRIRRKWHLLYTLIRNPILLKERRINGKPSSRFGARYNMFRSPYDEQEENNQTYQTNSSSSFASSSDDDFQSQHGEKTLLLGNYRDSASDHSISSSFTSNHGNIKYF